MFGRTRRRLGRTLVFGAILFMFRNENKNQMTHNLRPPNNNEHQAKEWHSAQMISCPWDTAMDIAEPGVEVVVCDFFLTVILRAFKCE